MKHLLCFFLFPVLLSACVSMRQNLPESERVIKRGNTDKLVVIFSATENTAEVGMAISKKMNTDYLRLIDPEKESISFIIFPKRNDPVACTPDRADLSKYSLVFIGSPIWWYHPTAYVYQFIKSHNLQGKKVVLFYTYAGGLGDNAIAEWTDLVEKAGGFVIDVFGIDVDEVEDKTLEQETDEIIGKRGEKWTTR